MLAANIQDQSVSDVIKLLLQDRDAMTLRAKQAEAIVRVVLKFIRSPNLPFMLRHYGVCTKVINVDPYPCDCGLEEFKTDMLKAMADKGIKIDNYWTKKVRNE